MDSRCDAPMVFDQEAADGPAGLHGRVATVPVRLLSNHSEVGGVVMRTTHKLKIWPQYFQPVLNGRMRCQLRRNDRDFQVGDHLLLQEWICPGSPHYNSRFNYTGREVEVRVDHIMDSQQVDAILEKPIPFVLMSISLLP